MTLRDVARVPAVSVTTASRILNGHETGIATVTQRGGEMGRTAAAQLFRMLAESSERPDVADIPLTPALVVRQSTSEPGSG